MAYSLALPPSAASCNETPLGHPEPFGVRLTDEQLARLSAAYARWEKKQTTL